MVDPARAHALVIPLRNRRASPEARYGRGHSRVAPGAAPHSYPRRDYAPDALVPPSQRHSSRSPPWLRRRWRLASRSTPIASRRRPRTSSSSRRPGYDMIEADHGAYLEIYGTAKQADRAARAGVGPRSSAPSARPPRADGRRAGRQRRRSSTSGAATTGSRDDNKEQYLELYDRLEGLAHRQEGLARDRRTWAATSSRSRSRRTPRRAPTTPARPCSTTRCSTRASGWRARRASATLQYFTTNYDTTPDNAVEAEVTELVNTRELWFMCVNNPDGYEYTFTPGNRLWRKNMADNDADGVRGEPNDGVDPNRNHATHWGLDNEGSSDDPLSETYRGTAPDSEPETKAIKWLWNHVDFDVREERPHRGRAAAVAERLPAVHADARRQALRGLRRRRRQLGDRRQGLRRGDRGMGDHRQPVRPGHRRRAVHHQRRPDRRRVRRRHPRLHARGIALGRAGTRPASSSRRRGRRSRPEFQRHKLFTIDLARSADDPAGRALAPRQHGQGLLRRVVRRFLRRSAGRAGRGQESLGDVKMRYRINDGAVKTIDTAPFEGGERFDQEDGIVLHRLRGTVTGTNPGDEVEVWFEGARRSSSHFTYKARSESNNKVLILSAENYTAGNPAYPDTHRPELPDLLHRRARRQRRRVRHLRRRQARQRLAGLPRRAEPLRRRGLVPRRRLHHPPDRAAARNRHRAARGRGDDRRPPLPQRGRQAVLHRQARRTRSTRRATSSATSASRRAGKAASTATRTAPKPPATPEFDGDDPSAADGCIAHNDDFLQYYLGAYTYAAPGNTFDDENGHPFPMRGTGPFSGLAWQFDETGANNQDNSATFVVTSSILDPAKFPWYADSRSVADWLRPGRRAVQPRTAASTTCPREPTARRTSATARRST